jgi:excisionase family DNA binding protein
MSDRRRYRARILISESQLPRALVRAAAFLDVHGLSPMTLAERLRSKNKALRVEELADLLGVAIRTVYKEVEDNRIPFFRIRSSIRFDPHQVAEWLEGKMVE